jgi:hypothetical protein
MMVDMSGNKCFLKERRSHFYVLYPFVNYLLTLSRNFTPSSTQMPGRVRIDVPGLVANGVLKAILFANYYFTQSVI